MQVVGKHLSEFALSIRGTSPDDGLFARSAFNRYYYATFLASRRLLIETTGTVGLPHKALPEYLIGQFQKTVIKQYPARTLHETAESRYWRRFRAPIVSQQVCLRDFSAHVACLHSMQTACF